MRQCATDGVRPRVHLKTMLGEINVGEQCMRVGRKRIEFYSPFEKIPGLGMHLALKAEVYLRARNTQS